MINSLSVDDVFVEDYRKFCANYLENVKKIAPPQATYEALPDDGGHKCVLQGILSGVPFVANRKMVVTYYPKEDGDDFVKSDIMAEWAARALGVRKQDCKALAGADNIVKHVRSLILDQRSNKMNGVSRTACQHRASAFDIKVVHVRFFPSNAGHTLA